MLYNLFFVLCKTPQNIKKTLSTFVTKYAVYIIFYICYQAFKLGIMVVASLEGTKYFQDDAPDGF